MKSALEKIFPEISSFGDEWIGQIEKLSIQPNSYENYDDDSKSKILSLETNLTNEKEKVAKLEEEAVRFKQTLAQTVRN